MTQRGPFQPLPFCDSVISPAKSTKIGGLYSRVGSLENTGSSFLPLILFFP